MTALHWAAFHNRPEHLQLLLMSGANMYSQDIDGKTPLHWAAEVRPINASNTATVHSPVVGSKLKVGGGLDLSEI